MTNQRLIVPATVSTPDEVRRNTDNHEKVYLMLLVFISEDGNESRDFILKRGRKECYEYLKDYIMNDNTLDVVASKVLPNGSQLGDEVNVGKFMRFIKDNFLVDDEFDIDDYVPSEDYISKDSDQLEEE